MARIPRIKARKSQKKSGRKLRLSRPIRYNTQRVGGPNTATVSLTLPSVNMPANAFQATFIKGLMPNTAGRQLEVAKQYALYRISKIVVRFKPYFDTYLPFQTAMTISGPISVPQLYWKINRFGDVPNASIGNVENYWIQQGAKPYRFDDKNLVVTYKPNILLSSTAPGVGSQVKMTPWIPTDATPNTATYTPSDVTHYGITYLINCPTSTGNPNPFIGTVQTTIYYQFKNPLVQNVPATEVDNEYELQGNDYHLNYVKIDLSGMEV